MHGHGCKHPLQAQWWHLEARVKPMRDDDVGRMMTSAAGSSRELWRVCMRLSATSKAFLDADGAESLKGKEEEEAV